MFMRNPSCSSNRCRYDLHARSLVPRGHTSSHTIIHGAYRRATAQWRGTRHFVARLKARSLRTASRASARARSARRSSGSSSPIDRRTVPSVIAGDPLLLGAQLAAAHHLRGDDQRLGRAETHGEREQLQRYRRSAAPPHAPPFRSKLTMLPKSCICCGRQRVLRMRRQPGVVHARHRRVRRPGSAAMRAALWHCAW